MVMPFISADISCSCKSDLVKVRVPDIRVSVSFIVPVTAKVPEDELR